MCERTIVCSARPKHNISSIPCLLTSDDSVSEICFLQNGSMVTEFAMVRVRGRERERVVLVVTCRRFSVSPEPQLLLLLEPWRWRPWSRTAAPGAGRPRGIAASPGPASSSWVIMACLTYTSVRSFIYGLARPQTVWLWPLALHAPVHAFMAAMAGLGRTSHQRVTASSSSPTSPCRRTW